MNSPGKVISVAPMMQWTNRHCRTFMRLLAPDLVLYTEMVVCGSIIHGDRERFLGFSEMEKPVVLQLGGSDPEQLGRCAKYAGEYEYQGVNLNVGCPSDRVSNAQFGACLMARPDQVGECVQAMQEAVNIPVTVKTRLGIDHMQTCGAFIEFVDRVSQYGCNEFIVHARKAWLKGLSPRENREVPPLRYDWVYQLKKQRPNLRIHLNGGLTTTQHIEESLRHTDGAMIGREAYANPWFLTIVNSCFFKDSGQLYKIPESRKAAVYAYLDYIERQLTHGVYLRHMTRHILGLFHGQPGAKSWRRYLSEHGPAKNAGSEVVMRALALVGEEHDTIAA